MNRPSILSAPPNLPIFLGQEPVPNTEGSIDQWLFKVEGALATHTEEVVRSAVIGSVRGAAHWVWGRNECHIEAHKRMIWARAFENKTPKRIFPDGAKENGKYKSICRMSGAAFLKIKSIVPW